MKDIKISTKWSGQLNYKIKSYEKKKDIKVKKINRKSKRFEINKYIVIIESIHFACNIQI